MNFRRWCSWPQNDHAKKGEFFFQGRGVSIIRESHHCSNIACITVIAFLFFLFAAERGDGLFVTGFSSLSVRLVIRGRELHFDAGVKGVGLDDSVRSSGRLAFEINQPTASSKPLDSNRAIPGVPQSLPAPEGAEPRQNRKHRGAVGSGVA